VSTKEIEWLDTAMGTEPTPCFWVLDQSRRCLRSFCADISWEAWSISSRLENVLRRAHCWYIVWVWCSLSMHNRHRLLRFMVSSLKTTLEYMPLLTFIWKSMARRFTTSVFQGDFFSELLQSTERSPTVGQLSLSLLKAQMVSSGGDWGSELFLPFKSPFSCR